MKTEKIIAIEEKICSLFRSLPDHDSEIRALEALCGVYNEKVIARGDKGINKSWFAGGVA